MGRGLAYRRAARKRAVARALRVVERLFWHTFMRLPDGHHVRRAEACARAPKWADNLKKCSCSMCNSGDPHDHRQFRRADAALRDEMSS